MISRVVLRAGVLQLPPPDGDGPSQPFQIELCPHCRASLVIPAEAGWMIDLVKLGPPDGTVLALIVPHDPGCFLLPPEPAQGFVARVPMSVLAVDTSGPPPHRFQAGGLDGPDGPVEADWCGYGALAGLLTDSAFCGRLKDDDVHIDQGEGGGHG